MTSAINHIEDIFKYIRNHIPFAIINASRSEFNQEENLKRNSALIKSIRGLDLSPFQLCGYWIDNITGKKTKEICFFIPFAKTTKVKNFSEFYQHMIQSGRRCQQQALVIGDGIDVYLVNLSNKNEDDILSLQKVGVSTNITIHDLNIGYCQHIHPEFSFSCIELI